MASKSLSGSVDFYERRWISLVIKKARNVSPAEPAVCLTVVSRGLSVAVTEQVEQVIY